MKRVLVIIAAFLAMGPGKLDSQRPETTDDASLSTLKASDLTFLGQVDTPGTQYLGQNLAMRYVGGGRRFLSFEYNTAGSGPQGKEYVGDLVEYKVTASLKNGDSHWVDANVPGWTE